MDTRDDDRNVEKSTNPSACRILYATQSGRAESCARRAARIIRERSRIRLTNRAGGTFDDEIQKYNDLFDLVGDLKRSDAFLLLFVSTTGDGEHTDTIQRTWKKLLQASLPRDLFEGIPFALFCLGDRAYGPQFCAAGRKLAVRLLQLGASLLCDPGYGDDGTPNGGVFADLDVWIQETLLAKLKNGHIVDVPDDDDSSKLSASEVPPNHYRVRFLDHHDNNDTTPGESRNDDEEEWQSAQFADSYRQFFETRCPLTAYTYDSETLQREETKLGDAKKLTSAPLLAQTVANDRITSKDSEVNTRHIRLFVRGTKGRIASTINAHNSGSTATRWDIAPLPYRAGDVAAILPSNCPQEVDRFLCVLPPALKNRAETVMEIGNNDDDEECLFGVGFAHWPRRCTLRGWLTYAADIHSLPAREDLRCLASCCSPAHPRGREQREKLISLSDTAGSALYADYVLREKRSWADVLYDFDSLHGADDNGESLLTIERLLSLLSPIRPREFSIASSPSRELMSFHQHGRTGDGDSGLGQCPLELCVAVVEGTTPLGRKFHGLCSDYLSRLAPAKSEKEGRKPSFVRLWIRPGSFHGLPLQLSENDAAKNGYHGNVFQTPLLCVGAGTGIAPLRALLHEREAVLKLHQPSKTTDTTDSTIPGASHDGRDTSNKLVRDNVLLFGCRKETDDFYYKKEWHEFADAGRLGLVTAFSREQRHKIYVQTVLREIEENDDTTKFVARHLLHRNGSLYIAGGPQMARGVKEEIADALKKEVGGDEKQAQKLLSKLQRLGRFSVEAWN